jgi:hypothetical protein
MASMRKNSRSKIAAAVKCDRPTRKPPDPIRALAIDIVDIFASLLREEEMHDAFVEVYGRIEQRWIELKQRE